MIVEIVFFDLPPQTTREATAELYSRTAAKWLTNPDLVQKYYFFDEPRMRGGGVYIWRSREAAEHWHGDDYRRMIRSLYGSEPRIEILDALIHVDPGQAEITQFPATLG